ncbi:hypothetical protein [Streptomyces luteocolor]|uniref:hypothetical protein n=1 Tax=Streptomyces luteocolor TaxID=285500 RepID=UPI000852DE15|nr:hypothetical protein [Streptomyces luteocolor]
MSTDTHVTIIGAGLAGYEQAMFPRGAEASAGGTEFLESLSGDDALDSALAMFGDGARTP